MKNARTSIAKRTAALAATCALTLPAYAAEVRPMGKLGYEFGGDTMVEVLFTDDSTRSIRANEGLFFGGGASIVSDAKTMEIELTLAYKFQLISASNGDVTWSRWPVEALAFYRLPQVRLGGGLTYHLNPKVSSSGDIGGLNLKFENALGVVLQGDYRLNDRANLGLRFTSLQYTVKSGGAGTAKSNGIGVSLSASF